MISGTLITLFLIQQQKLAKVSEIGSVLSKTNFFNGGKMLFIYKSFLTGSFYFLGLPLPDDSKVEILVDNSKENHLSL